jgi:hypothetical protein
VRSIEKNSKHTSYSGAAEKLTGIVGLFLVKRQVAAVDARQPFDQALRKPVWELLLLERGYIIRWISYIY